MKLTFSILYSVIFVFIISCEKNPNEVQIRNNLWAISSPEAQQMNAQIVDSAFIKAKETKFIDGLLVIRNGKLVKQQYYNGYNAWQPHHIMSVSKSFLSAITGIAFHQGYIDSLNEKVMDYFPEYIYPDMDPRKYDITIKHLLTMRMGIQGEADNNYEIYWNLYTSENWIKSTNEMPLLFNPGEQMGYNTFETHLLSAIITKATKQSTLEFADENLFKPMGIDCDAWEQDPQGYYFGGTSMYFTLQEMALFGYLYLKNGILNDLQIIPQNWVELTLSASTNNQHPNEWGAWKNYNYAWLWWLGQINDYDLFMAYGYGGQFIMVFPALNIIIVTTSRYEVDSDTSTIQEWAIFDIVADYIIPSLIG
jgi:CubicO group peptidase (beta-lactamase class C family)